MSARQLIAGLLCAALAAALAGCGEKPQTFSDGYRRSADQPWRGPATAFSAPGWQAGDETDWQRQIRTRGQAQNDYARAH